MGIQRLGKYEILEPLGRGGMGVVYRARDTELGRIVALKLLPDEFRHDAVRRARFLREAQAAAALNHPNIATLYEVGGLQSDAGDEMPPYLAMELVEGRDLAELIAHELDPRKALEIAVQIAEGLAAAHEAGVVHRDLKPRNVRVTPAGVAKILDFGLARFEPLEATPSDGDSFHTQQGAVMGTAPYMAPEQARGEPLDGRADLFSLGVILYQMLGRAVPFRGRNIVDYVRKAESSDFTPLSDLRPGIDPLVERVVEKLLAPRPEDRYSSAHDVALMLRDVSTTGSGRHDDPTQGPTVALDESPVPSRSTRAGGRHPALRWLGLALSVAVIVALTLLLQRSPAVEAEELRIAVLPFENRTAEVEWDLLAGGLAPSLSGVLTSEEGLFVLQHRVAAGYAGRNDGLRLLADEYSLERVVEGQIRAAGERAVVEVSVADAQTGESLWFGSFDAEAGELPRLLQQLARAICEAVERGDSAGFEARMDALGRRSTQALRDHLLALAYLQSGQSGDRLLDLEMAQRLFEDALELDPELASAHAGLARTWVEIDRLRGEPELLAAAIEEAETALRLEPELGEARLLLARLYQRAGREEDAAALLDGMVDGPDSESQESEPESEERQQVRALLASAELQIDQGDLEAAEATVRQALAIDEDAWDSWSYLGEVEMRRGREEAAREAFRRAMELAPAQIVPFDNYVVLSLIAGESRAAVDAYELWRGPLDGFLALNMGTAYYDLGEMEKAEEAYLTAVALEPANEIARGNLGDLYRATDREERARREYRSALEIVEERLEVFPDNESQQIERIYALARLEECGPVVEEGPALVGRVAVTYESMTRLAKAFALCGLSEPAIRSLELLAGTGMTLGRVACEDELRSLRGEPGFEALFDQPTATVCE